MKAVLDRVGIAVTNLEESLAFFRDGLGLEVDAQEEVPSQKVRAQLIGTGALVAFIHPSSAQEACWWS